MTKNFMNLPTAEQFDIQNALLASIASNVGSGGIEITSWNDVQKVVRMGLADKIFKVGDQLVSSYGETEVAWDVIGINHDVPTNKSFQHSLTIQAHDCIMNCQFDAVEALYYAEEELSAGKQIFTQDNSLTQYEFTTAQPIPTGGQIVVTSWNNYVPVNVTTYREDGTTVIESNIPVSEGSGEDTLLDINARVRAKYGSNSYLESNIRQWLNSKESTFKWTPKYIYGRPPTGSPYTGGGFLRELDPELSAVLGEVDKKVAKRNDSGGGQDSFSDKVFLLSRVEVDLGTEGTTTGETIYPFYDGKGNANRIKNLGNCPRSWWLRSPHVSHSYYARIVTTGGSLSNYFANTSYGLSPACTIV